MNSISLAEFDNNWYKPGRSRPTRVLWFLVGLPILRSSILPFSSLRRCLLRIFGARIGRGTVIKPGVRVKYPWLFVVGDHCWIGEDCWIDNMGPVTLGNHVCMSQGAYVCTGNHDWSDPAFGLMVNSIQIRDGAWVGAKTVLAPGVAINECAVVAAGSVITRDVPPFEVHGGNPARFLRRREIKTRRSGEPDLRPRLTRGRVQSSQPDASTALDQSLAEPSVYVVTGGE
jgi:putative colanic acid biosynthesis acetyltransferase WcaF